MVVFNCLRKARCWCLGDVTVGGTSVIFTSGFLFLVGLDLNRSTCSGDFLGNTYFQSNGLSKVGNKISGLVISAVPVGLAAAVAFFAITKNNKRWGNRQ